MTPLWGHSETVASFVQYLIPECYRGFGPCQAMGVIDHNGRLVGGFVFHDWQPECGTVELSAASVDRRWLTRPIMAEVAGYVFGTLGCQMVVTRNNPDAHQRRIWKALGGVEYEIARMRGRDKAEILITVTEEAWRASKFAGGHHAEGKSRRIRRASEEPRPGAGHGRRPSGAGRAGGQGQAPVAADAAAGE